MENILSDPHGVRRWSQYFGERRSTTRLRLEHMQARGVAVEFAGRWQIRSSEWPVSYWRDHDWLPIGPDGATGGD